MTSTSATVIYALAAPARSALWTWCTISALLVRRTSPGLETALVVDRQTAAALDAARHPLLHAVDHVVTSDAGDADPRVRSRRVKTSVRQLVDGDLIFLDADTVPIRPIDAIAAIDADFAAVPEPEGSLEAISRWYPPACDALGWKCPEERYFNSGVFLLRETEAGRWLGAEWASRWERWQDYDTSGRPADQPALNAALTEFKGVQASMPQRYNVMVGLSGRADVPDPVVFHFFASKGKMPNGTLLSALTTRFEQTGEIDDELIRRAQRRQSPWVRSAATVRMQYFARGVGRYLRRTAFAVDADTRSRS